MPEHFLRNRGGFVKPIQAILWDLLCRDNTGNTLESFFHMQYLNILNSH